MNRLANSKNRFQGDFKRVLLVCSAGILRSPTAAFVLSQEPYNYNTRAVGVSEDYALIHIDEVHIEWAQEIVCMGKEQESYIWNNFGDQLNGTPVINLEIPDNFRYRDPKLMEMIKTRYDDAHTVWSATDEIDNIIDEPTIPL